MAGFVALIGVVGALAIGFASEGESDDGLVTSTTLSQEAAPVTQDAGVEPGETALPEDPATAPAPSLEASANGNGDEIRSHSPRSQVVCAAQGTPTGALPGDDPRNGKRWVTLGHLKGACDGSGPTFSVEGKNTRLAWRSDAVSFVAFVVDAELGLDATAGYADAECAGSCAEYQFINIEEGRYALQVQADGGPWEIVLQEYR